MSLALYGTGIGRGIVIGRVRRLEERRPEITETRIAKRYLNAEVSRYQDAREAARAGLRDARAKIPSDTPDEIAAFIDSHLLMLDDDMLGEAISQIIREQRCNAEWALKQQGDMLMATFAAMDDPYLRTRRDDVEHVVERIQRILARSDDSNEAPVAVASDQPSILVCDDLPPADLVSLYHADQLEAFITEHGGPLSHTAVLARSLDIPAIVGARGVTALLEDGEDLILDARSGALIAGPDDRAIEQYKQRQRAEVDRRAVLAGLRDQAATTEDGQTVALRANVELTEDISAAMEAGAEGIGLYRTEFMFLGRDKPPTEEEHYETYLQLSEAANWNQLTIRTYDLGADKTFVREAAPKGFAQNPALGLRAIRLCLRDQTLFRPQIRALLRVAVKAKIRILLPMVSRLGEILQAKEIIREEIENLRAAGIECADNVPLGIMVEVPAAALASRQLAAQVDFMSIGTNDLIQYTLAIDRNDETVTHLYDPLHPAVLRLIRMAISACHAANIPIAMCGEMAGDPSLARLLLGLGLREFSMHPSSILEIKQIITQSDTRRLMPLSADLLQAPDSGAAAALLEQINQG